MAGIPSEKPEPAAVTNARLYSIIGSITIEQIPAALKVGIEVMESVKGLSGLEKKERLTQAIVYTVDRSNVTGSLEPMVLRMIPFMIDALVEVSDKGLRVNKRAKRGMKRVWDCCLSCKRPDPSAGMENGPPR